jgi:exoribonuclease R
VSGSGPENRSKPFNPSTPDTDHRGPHPVVPRVRYEPVDDLLRTTLRTIRDNLELPESFPAEVEAEATEAVKTAALPELDRTGIPFVTIDPQGATDLDQAMHLERDGEGYVVHYAIADVPAFVRGGGAVDTEARGRGQTLYAPDGRIPLHPTVISESAASLLPGQVRGAYLWTFQLDAAANVTRTTLERARIRSREQLTYVGVQAQLDDGTADPSLTLLPEVGAKRVELERARGGASLNRPDEEVMLVDGSYTLVRRESLPVEEWNAQISLMTGMAAAKVMLDGRLGILRTMPPPYPDTLERFRREVAALGCPWPKDLAYGQYLRTLDRTDPRGLAAIHAATALFRGAGYTAFDGELPENMVQAAVAAPYAHATAPLRRLVDRFVLVICEALLNGRAVPTWAREALPSLPKIMQRSDSLASRLEHASVDALEAALLTARVGAVFDAIVVAERDGGGVIQLTEPVVTATIAGAVAAGDVVRVKLVTADIATGVVAFELA